MWPIVICLGKLTLDWISVIYGSKEKGINVVVLFSMSGDNDSWNNGVIGCLKSMVNHQSENESNRILGVRIRSNEGSFSSCFIRSS